MKTIVVMLVIATLGAGGGYFYGRYDEHMTEVAQDSLKWPSVAGLVTSSNLEARQKKVGRQSTTDFRVEIDYEYVVDGERFENDVVRFNQNNLSRSEKELLVSTHPKGRQVEVFYNPGKPQQSVLIQGSWP